MHTERGLRQWSRGTQRTVFLHRRLACALLAAVAVTVGLVVAVANPAVAVASPPLPAVYPAPQSITAHGGAVPLGASVALLTGDGTDRGAVSALRTVLTANGVTTIDEIGDPGKAATRETVIYLGGAAENPATAGALTSLGVRDARGLAAQGYVLATGVIAGHPSVVLDGHDTDGTYYAVQTLRQIITTGPQGSSVAGVQVRDWPTMPLRGIIEGFYGPEWSNADRMSMFDFEAENKMNIFVYSPKDDPYLRAQWRDQYPAEQLDAIQQLAQRATADHVQFTYAISPGLSVCYSSADDEATLVAKLESIYAVGVRSFSIPFDDITEGQFNCAADTAKFGSGNAAAAAAQAYLLNEVQADFIAKHPDVQPLQMVPTEYCTNACGPYSFGAGDAYTTTLRTRLDSSIIVGWTGTGTVPATITPDQAAFAKQVYGHPVLLWDNYPVNDYVTNRLLLGPYVGRATGLSADLYGITANPMVEAEPSKIALFGVAAYSWNDAAYDAKKAWTAGIKQIAGPDPHAQRALAALADLSYSSNIDGTQSPTLTALINSFWPAWESGTPGADAQLAAYLKVIASVPATLAAGMHNPAFVDESQRWLSAAGEWGTAAGAALKMLTDEQAGRIADAVADRIAAETGRAKATQSAAALDSASLDSFITRALAENGRFLGVPATDATGPQAITSLPTYLTNTPSNMIDGNADTYFWSSTSPSVGSYVGVDLGSVATISSVTIQAGDATSPGDYIQNGVLEYSTDGATWHPIGTYVNQPNITATLPAGTAARYVRLRAAAADSNWVKVHEFDVAAQFATSGHVSGTPAAADGSTLAAAGDSALTTTYTAASKPAAGDALVLSLPEAKSLAQVEVIGTGQADVQLRVGGQWRSTGALSAGGYTELSASGVTASAIRLVWVPGSPAPSITEIVPRYTADESLALSATTTPTEVPVGSTAQLNVQLTSTLTAPVDHGLLTIKAPAGLQANPPATTISVLRGGQASTDIKVTAAQPGTYPVTLTYTAPGIAPVTTTVEVTVPRVLYDFEDGTAQGWQAGENIRSVAAVSSFANGPLHPHGGTYALEASSSNVSASAWRTASVTPANPLDLSGGTLSLWVDGYGGAAGATGYQARLVVHSGDQSTSLTVPISNDTWNHVQMDLSRWSYANDVTKIEVSYRPVTNSTDAWPGAFDIDDVDWIANANS